MVSFVTFPRGGIQFLWLCNRFPQLGLSHTCLPSSLGFVGGSPSPALWARPMGPRAVHMHTWGAVLLVWGHLDRLRWEPGAGGPWGQRAAALVCPLAAPAHSGPERLEGEVTGSEVALEHGRPKHEGLSTSSWVRGENFRGRVGTSTAGSGDSPVLTRLSGWFPGATRKWRPTRERGPGLHAGGSAVLGGA